MIAYAKEYLKNLFLACVAMGIFSALLIAFMMYLRP